MESFIFWTGNGWFDFLSGLLAPSDEDVVVVKGPGPTGRVKAQALSNGLKAKRVRISFGLQSSPCPLPRPHNKTLHLTAIAYTQFNLPVLSLFVSSLLKLHTNGCIYSPRDHNCNVSQMPFRPNVTHLPQDAWCPSHFVCVIVCLCVWSCVHMWGHTEQDCDKLYSLDFFVPDIMQIRTAASPAFFFCLPWILVTCDRGAKKQVYWLSTKS